MPEVGTQQLLVEAIGSSRSVAAADRLCAACLGLLDIDAVAMSLVFDGENTGTFGASDPAARNYAEVQFTLGEGPCLDAVSTRSAVVSAELSLEPRWPAYTATMLTHGIHCAGAIPIVVGGQYVGTLDVFRRRAGPLSSEDLIALLTAAELAQLPLLDLLSTDLSSAGGDPDSDIWTELGTLTRTEVNQATGMLVAQLGIAPAHALARLRAHAYTTGRSASDTARDILDRGLRLDVDDQRNGAEQ